MASFNSGTIACALSLTDMMNMMVSASDVCLHVCARSVGSKMKENILCCVFSYSLHCTVLSCQEDAPVINCTARYSLLMSVANLR